MECEKGMEQETNVTSRGPNLLDRRQQLWDKQINGTSFESETTTSKVRILLPRHGIKQKLSLSFLKSIRFKKRETFTALHDRRMRE